MEINNALNNEEEYEDINKIIKYDNEETQFIGMCNNIYPNPYSSNLFDVNKFDNLSDEHSADEKLINNKLILLKKKPKSNSLRKYDFDAVRGRVKIKACEGIRKYLNDALKLDKKFQFRKLPSNYTSDSYIALNKSTLKLTVKELFESDFGDVNKDKLQHNRRVIQKIFWENLDQQGLLSMSVKELFDVYFKSKLFQYDLKVIESKQGQNYKDIFEEVVMGSKRVKGYIEYFETEMPNNKLQINKIKKPKKLKEIKKDSEEIK